MRCQMRWWTVSIMLIACVCTCSLVLYAYLAQSLASTVLKLGSKMYSSRPQLIDASQAGVSENIESEKVTDTRDRTEIAEITTQLINQYLLNYSYQLDRSPWSVADEWVMPTKQLYPERAPELGAVLHAMLQSEITAADVEPYGSQIKLAIMLKGNQSVIFKPKRASISEVRPKIHPYYEFVDRHNAEIAAFHLSRWHKHEEYCYRKVLPTYDLGIVLDIVDMSILDYIIQNGDRHSIMTFRNWTSSRVVMLDNANGFGDPNDDLRSMLAPLYQCCRVRMRTYNQLKLVSRGNLRSVLGAVLAQDRLAPVLTDAHLRALDRRLLYVINEVRFCIERHSAETVLNTSD